MKSDSHHSSWCSLCVLSAAQLGRQREAKKSFALNPVIAETFCPSDKALGWYKQKDLGSIPLRFSSLFENYGLWIISCDSAHTVTFKTALIAACPA